MKRNVARASMTVAIIGILSKIMGTIRQSMIAYSFGQSELTDAYNSANKIAYLTTVILNASIITVLIPIMDKAKNKGGIQEKNRFFNNISTIIFLSNLVLCFLTAVAAPLLVDIISPGFEESLKAITVDLVRIIAPGIIFLGAALCLGAYQQSNFIFAPFAAVGVVNNIVFYIYLLLMGKSASIYGLAVITTVGAVVQMLFLLPFMRKQEVSFKPEFNLKDSFAKDSFYILLPLTLSHFVGQISVLTTNALASMLESGMVTVLNNAYVIFSAIMNLLVMSISTVIFPLLAEAFNKEDHGTIKSIVEEGTDFFSIILIPASLGIIALATPITQIIYQRGQFTTLDTEMTKAALVGYAIGMLGNGLKIYYNRIFISFQDSVTAFKNTIFNAVVNIILAFLLIIPLNFRGLALAQGIAGILSAGLFAMELKKRIPELRFSKSLKTLMKLIFISIIMGMIVNRTYLLITSFIGTENIHALIGCGISIAIGVLFYLIAIFVFRVESALRWKNILKAKLEKRRK